MSERFINFVAEIMGVPSDSLCATTAYGELPEWDSMMMLTLVMELEAEYGVSIPIEKVGDIRDLKDLYEFVKDND